MTKPRGYVLVLGCLLLAGAECQRPTPTTDVPPGPKPGSAPNGASRSYLMGFSVIPPKPDLKIAVRSLGIWSSRADAAIMHMDVPWALLLNGSSPRDALKKDGVDLEHYYRSRGLKLVVTIDVTNGLDRASEAKDLVSAHRSITEPAVQQLYRDY